MQKLLKVPEAAEALNLSQKKIWGLVYGRELEVVRFGRAVRIPSSSIAELISKGTTPARPS
jgi:excisionase family DNA binding protein